MPSVLVETVCPIPLSLPNHASPVMDSSGASGADKKRNKLGYSRTSVACGQSIFHPPLCVMHCRRRKIRCLVSADDSEGRCENCIRLRKECQFYPVDQQPPTDRKARPGNTPTSSADPSIASSSPPSAVLGGAGGAAGGPIDPNDIYHYQITSATTPEMAATAFHPSGFSVAPMGAFSATNNAVPHPELVPSQTIDPNASWEHPAMGNPAQMMWTTPQGQILAAGGAPPHPQMLGPAAAAPYTVQLDGTLWPAPPQRAMTIPSQADIYSHPPPQGHPGFASSIPPELKRSMTSPAVSRSQISPLQSPATSQMQVPVNYSSPPIAFQQHQPPPPRQPWSNMNTIPMGDGSYATMFAAPPDQFPMGQHPTTGP
ncbi:hypothetical protein UA08_02867 [Talaromyces atroroseus]|uniref:Uncharacterized protein n=1 Tax=Talaromyces atroroseus TaxID=1441469 RepID=A0A225AL59_TALAT|nr:hypothetical protein UA08_02867 [Talaromyces atroroseus]OKL62272.1 hypothetical protein UA08_02867 [Talaromyces atroroseus]